MDFDAVSAFGTWIEPTCGTWRSCQGSRWIMVCEGFVVLEWNWAILYVINAWWFIPGREFTAHDWTGRPYPTYDWDYHIDPGGSTIPS